jgi:TatD DNase family protein
MMKFFDTHCHIHEILADTHVSDESHSGGESMHERWKKNDKTAGQVLADAAAAGVESLICVGCTGPDSKLAVEFVKGRDNLWASIGIHPHEAQDYANYPKKLAEFAELTLKPKVVAVGECGLDYFYEHSPKQDQEKILRFQIELALKHNLPMIFHVRDAFEDFWPIFDSYSGIRGVVHSFSAGEKELGQIIERGLYVGLNGIMTFTKQVKQLDAAKLVPKDCLLLETDAPFLTPQPFRGNICEPKHVRVTAEFLAGLRGESLEELAKTTYTNARFLFGL